MARDLAATVELKVRLKEPLRAQLEAAANRRGVSMNAEGVARWEQSFRDDSSLLRLLDATFGPRLAGVLMLLGKVMKVSGWTAAAQAGASMSASPGEAVADWLNDPWGYEQAVQAAVLIIEANRPPGEVRLPEQLRGLQEPERSNFASAGLEIASSTLRMLCGQTPSKVLGELDGDIRQRVAITARRIDEAVRRINEMAARLRPAEPDEAVTKQEQRR